MFEQLENQISRGIKAARTLFGQSITNDGSAPATQAAFDTLGQSTCCIWILRNGIQAWKTPDVAMRAIGSNLQTYRHSLPLHNRTVFGLPLMSVDNRTRHASPLLLRIVELQGGSYVGVAVLFKTGINQNYSLIEKWAENFSGRIKVEL